ncbi:hypothetical protein IGI04_008370 [Brassica rapa subsp. trilocularis]|uniref:RNase H type-1 domain-containing protein n=1 Tax=Brassica rapa subsp. trilocularis TaxID=1813537 RepID=A0ABQ7NMF4_BRACM|nr:hypothetical protein IGI04_008370 [Brassica rapa subsp. trilocularis]
MKNKQSQSISGVSYRFLKAVRPNHFSQARLSKSDAAWRIRSTLAGISWSFYHANGEMRVSHSKAISFVISPFVAEGLPMRRTMEHAGSLGLTKMIFKSNSQQLVTAIGRSSSFLDLHGIVSDIKLMADWMESVSFRLRHRSNFFLRMV